MLYRRRAAFTPCIVRVCRSAAPAERTRVDDATHWGHACAQPAQPLRRYKEAERDYLSILEVAPEDPAAWNNLGNTNIGLGNYDAAAGYFARAVALSPAFSFAAANRCVALFAAGKVNESMREMRAVLRRYPDFPDTRAALTAALWSIGKEGEAETNWCFVCCPVVLQVVWLCTWARGR
jgi:predicted Zn-dependent protease